MSFFVSRKIWTLIIILLSISGCYKSTKEISSDICLTVINISCIKKNTRVEMNTSKGLVVLEIDSESAPLTASNFLSIVNRGLYEGTIFNRVIRKPFPFIVQGGYKDLQYNFNSNFKSNDESYIKKGSAPLVKIPLEIKLKGEANPRYNKLILNYDDFNRIELNHLRGSLAMARSQVLDSASIQFYISLKDLPELDGRYSVFGRVVNGMNVIDSLNEGDFIINMKVIKN